MNKKEEVEVMLGDFDPRVIHHMNAKTRRIEKTNPYRLHVVDSVRYFEWPQYSGNLWHEDRSPAGRVEYDADGSKKIIREAVHKAWTPPLNPVEREQRELNNLRQRTAELEAELSAIKAEAEAPKRKINKKPDQAN